MRPHRLARIFSLLAPFGLARAPVAAAQPPGGRRTTPAADDYKHRMMQRPRWDEDTQNREADPVAEPPRYPGREPLWDEPGADGRYEEPEDTRQDAEQWEQRYLAVHEVEKSFAG